MGITRESVNSICIHSGRIRAGKIHYRNRTQAQSRKIKKQSQKKYTENSNFTVKKTDIEPDQYLLSGKYNRQFFISPHWCKMTCPVERFFIKKESSINLMIKMESVIKIHSFSISSDQKDLNPASATYLSIALTFRFPPAPNLDSSNKCVAFTEFSHTSNNCRINSWTSLFALNDFQFFVSFMFFL